jgi:hypothetical protein
MLRRFVALKESAAFRAGAIFEEMEEGDCFLCVTPDKDKFPALKGLPIYPDLILNNPEWYGEVHEDSTNSISQPFLRMEELATCAKKAIAFRGTTCSYAISDAYGILTVAMTYNLNRI